MTFPPFNSPIPGVRGRHDLSPFYIAITRRKFLVAMTFPPFKLPVTGVNSRYDLSPF
jgi:hypothetical protein